MQSIPLSHAKTLFEVSRVSCVFSEAAGKHKDIVAQTGRLHDPPS